MKSFFVKNTKSKFSPLLLSILAFPFIMLNGQLKEDFNLKDRLHLLKMATFGPTAQMVSDVNNTNSNILSQNNDFHAQALRVVSCNFSKNTALDIQKIYIQF